MEAGGWTQGDKAAGPPPKENRTSGRIAKRPRRVDQRRRWRRMRGMMMGGGTPDLQRPPTARRSGSEVEPR